MPCSLIHKRLPIAQLEQSWAAAVPVRTCNNEGNSAQPSNSPPHAQLSIPPGRSEGRPSDRAGQCALHSTERLANASCTLFHMSLPF